MLSLRPYQSEAVDSIYKHFQQKSTNPLVVLPTGAGKSLCIAQFVKEVMQSDPNHRIIMATHVRELVSQNFEELLGHYPECDAGIYSAGLGARNHSARVLFCSIQSIYSKAALLNWCDLLIIDEVHLLPFKGEGMYRTFIKDMLRFNAAMKVIGFTATPFRMKGGWLHKGDGALFSDISYEANVLDLVEQGYLARLVAKPMKTQMDVSNVPTSGGEFVAKHLEVAVDLPDITRSAVQEIVEYGKDRKTWLVFGAGVSHCEHIRDEIKSHGISAECIFGNTPKKDRNRIVADHKSGKLRALVCRFVGTTGYNCKSIDLIADMAPTQSAALHVQKLGRGTRLFANKNDCLVLDFGGNVRTHGAIDQVKPHQPRSRDPDEETEAPVKTCPECGVFVRIQDMECPDCGFLFPKPKPKIDTSASLLAPMTDRTPKRVSVDKVLYSRHNKIGSPPSVLVQYFCGFQVHKEWVPIENPKGRRFAVQWWNRRSRLPVPSTVEKALEASELLTRPKEITVAPNGKYTRVIDVHF